MIVKQGLALAAISFALSACANLSQNVAEDVHVGSVAERVECELREAYMSLKGDYPWLSKWAASFVLTIKQEDKAGVAPTIAYGVPIDGNKFTFGGGAELSETGTRTLTTKRTVLLKKLEKFKCSMADDGPSRLSGRLYIAKPLASALGAYDKRHPLNEEPDDLGYRIDFLLRASANGNPSFGFLRVTGIGFDASVSREKTQTLDIAFADATPKGPSEVVIVEKKDGQERRIIERRVPNVVSPEAMDNLNGTLFRLQRPDFKLR